MYSLEVQNRQNEYSRTNAVTYALTYALKPNPDYRYFPLVGNNSGDCSNFVSQCLKAGGAEMSYMANHEWWYNNKGTKGVFDDTWSISWTVAHALYWYLRINSKENLSGVKGFETNNINSLLVGDLMFFEDYRGVIFHSAIITSFIGSTPLLSHHSFEARNIPFTKSYSAKKIHYLKISI